MEFATAITLEPSATDRSRVDELRRHGLDDRAILDATHIVGFFNHINRVAEALGVDLEDFMPPAPAAAAGPPAEGAGAPGAGRDDQA